MMYGLKSETINAIQEVLAKNPEVEKAILYGSRAKGKYRPGSDIDLTLIGKELNLSILQKVENELDDLLLPYKMDMSLFKQIQNTELIDHIKRVGKVFYERPNNNTSKTEYISGWMEYKFSDFVEINPTISMKGSEKYSFVEMKDLQDGNKFCFPSIERHPSSGARFNDGDTLFARITPCLENGKICKVKGLKNGIGFGSTEFLVFRGKDNVSDNEFVFYLSRWDEVRGYAESRFEGTSGRQRVPKNCFDSFFLNLPPLPEQTAIAKVLSSLDDKIDLLHRQNKTLEQLAETLFRQWFVEEAEESWEREPLGKYVTIKRGGSPRPIHDYISEAGLNWLKISDVTSVESPFIFEIKEKIKAEGLSKTTFLKKGSLVLSNSATPGIPKILDIDSCIHDGWLHFPKSEFSKEFLYLLFKYIRPELLQMGNGSIFTNLKTDILKEYVLAIPKEQALAEFDEQIKTIFEKIYSNTTQIRTLTQLRDTLLPKLMSGEVRIES